MEEPSHAQAARPLSNAHLQNARSADMNSRCHNVDLYEGTAMGWCFTNTVTFFNKNIHIASTTSKRRLKLTGETVWQLRTRKSIGS
jgi:hypothetical protein